MAAIRIFYRLLARRLCLRRPHRGIPLPGPMAVALPLLIARGAWLLGSRLLNGDLYRLCGYLDGRLIVARRVVLLVLMLILLLFLPRMPVAAAAIASAA